MCNAVKVNPCLSVSEGESKKDRCIPGLKLQQEQKAVTSLWSTLLFQMCSCCFAYLICLHVDLLQTQIYCFTVGRITATTLHSHKLFSIELCYICFVLMKYLQWKFFKKSTQNLYMKNFYGKCIITIWALFNCVIILTHYWNTMN